MRGTTGTLTCSGSASTAPSATDSLHSARRYRGAPRIQADCAAACALDPHPLDILHALSSADSSRGLAVALEVRGSSPCPTAQEGSTRCHRMPCGGFRAGWL